MAPLLVGVLLFDGYETLDAHGPIEIFGTRATQEHFAITTVSQYGGKVRSSQGVTVLVDHSFQDCPQLDVLLVPGGYGTRQAVENVPLLRWLVDTYLGSGSPSSAREPLKHLMSVCTGSALLAKAGLLDGHQATSNKLAWEWATSQSKEVHWVRQARWVTAGNILTSAGVSAGMDMALHFVAQLLGDEKAAEVARLTEYNGQWTDPTLDPWGASGCRR